MYGSVVRTAALLLGLWLGLSGVARADESTVDDAADQILGEAAWGMSPGEVLEALKERLRAKYAPQIADARGALERDGIRESGRAELRRIKDTYLAFDGHVTGWDISPVGPEFRHGADEAMMYIDAEQHRDYFFFIKGHLWKCYRAFNANALGGSGFEAIHGAFAGRLGDVQESLGLREPGGDPARFARWQGLRSRFDLVDGGTHLVMVVSSLSTLSHLDSLRRNALPRGHKKKHTIVEAILLSEEQQDALRNGASVETALRH